MITITNPKVAGFMPVWASIKGFSLLFDNPGNSLVQMPGNASLYQLECDPALELYRAFNEALNDIEQLVNTYLFCPLPYSSYHVTVWDGLNDGNVGRVTPGLRPGVEEFLARLPDSFPVDSSFIKDSSGRLVQISMDSPVKFEFRELSKWSNNSLVAQLRPVDQSSEEVLARIKDKRQKLLLDFQERFGIRTSSVDYAPHVTLGYFANKEHAELATPLIDIWMKQFIEKVAGKILTFQSIGLYGFLDMITFFKS